MHTAASTGARRDVARDITIKIITVLERGVMPWRKPWDGARAGLPLPRRVSGEPYRGVNVLLLWNAACDRGCASPFWLTFRQAIALGAHVRKGERGEQIVFYGQAQRPLQTEDDETTASYRFLKSYTVFNADQIEGLPDRLHAAATPAPIALETHERWFAKLGIDRMSSHDTACYIPSRDVIAMPPVAVFDSAEAYAATLNHETVHATGAKHRLDRDFSRPLGGAARAMEELVAEIGAAILGAHHGLAPSHIEDHAAYISSWMALLDHDHRLLLQAAAKAQAAVDWLLERSAVSGEGDTP